MPSPFTPTQIRAMTDVELDDRIAVAVGHGAWHDDVNDPTGAALWPWWKSPFNDQNPRRRVLELIGDQPAPWPPTYCRDAEACEAACTESAVEYDDVHTPRWNAEELLITINAGVSV